MSVISTHLDTDAAVAMRRRATAVRVAIMAVIALLLGSLGGWRYAGAWWAAYSLLQIALIAAERRAATSGPALIYALCFVTYSVAGAPSWYLWTHVGDLGIATATMFLCGMLVQLVVSSLAARYLFWASAAPLIAYLIVVPALAFGHRTASGLATSLCAVLLTAYLAVLWRGQQAALIALDESRRQAEAANRAKTDFLATMSHEIRTPMNAVLGAAHLLGASDLSDDQREHVDILLGGGVVLMHILNDVLDLSAIEAGKLAIEPTPQDLHLMVRRCADFWRPRIAEAGLDLIVDISETAPRFVVIDGSRTGQILFNFISNAVKFTGSGSITVALEAAPAADGRHQLALSVRDTGMGMKPSAVEGLFTAFQQADGSISRQFGGAGLGLSIARKLAIMMGGDIIARSEEGVGSTFTLRLPVRLGSPMEAQQDRSAPDLETPAAALRILVADDHPANRRIIELFLRPLGADVTIVDDGQQAVDILALSVFDVVLMDMQMPVMDGVRATQVIRASPGPNQQVPILALTANVLQAQRQLCLDAGMTGHIAKPIDPRALITTIMSAVRGGEAEIAERRRALAGPA